MTFEEWWAEQHYGMRLFSFTSEETARAAWQAAQQAEREACARLCEESYVAIADPTRGIPDRTAQRIATKIRQRGEA